MALSQNVWALVVGIDYYSADPKGNLEGCVRDAENVFEFLITSIQVPEDHITRLLAPEPSAPLLRASHAEPKHAHIIEALTQIQTKAKPGDFVWFHFSGHGDRVQTKYSTLKTDTNYDEVLCALDDDIRDVELDASLSQLTNAGLKVLAVLDSCHSGGATRHRRALKIRCRPHNHEGGAKSQPIKELEAVSGPAVRAATVRETWFYRNRNYHVIAACQPYQLASEYVDEQGLIHGGLTHFLLKALRSHKHVGKLKYKMLQQRLDSECWLKLSQQPMILGDGNALLGGDAIVDTDAAGIAVLEIRKDTLILNKGTAAGVSIGDQYELYPTVQDLAGTQLSRSSVEVLISSVDGMTAQVDAVDISGEFSSIGVGCFGRLKRRAQIAKVQVLPFPAPHAKHMAKLFKPSGIRAFDFDFSDEQKTLDGRPAFVVRISAEGYIEVLDDKSAQLTPIPRISVNEECLLDKLINLLQHLQAYQALETMKPMTKSRKPGYSFRVLDANVDDDDPNVDILATKQVVFKNLEPRPVFVTIFNLTAAWGVYRIFPFDDDASLAVEPGNEIPELIIDMQAPNILKKDASADGPKEMRDVLKVLITPKQTNFDHYQLKDLEWDMVAGHNSFRNARARSPRVFDWYCDQIVIYTRL